METAHFWSATLDKSNREKQWASSEDEDVRTLSFSNIFLGEPSKAGEQNLVKLEFSDVDGEEVSCVLCVLQKGHTETMQLSLKTSEDFKIVLAKGSGPVHVTATESCQFVGDMDDDASLGDPDEEEDEMEMTSDVSPVVQSKSKALMAGTSGKVGVASKKKFLDEEDSGEDHDDSGEAAKQSKVPSPPAKKKKVEAEATKQETKPKVNSKKEAPKPNKVKLPEMDLGADDDDDEDEEDEDDDEDEQMPKLGGDDDDEEDDDDDEEEEDDDDEEEEDRAILSSKKNGVKMNGSAAMSKKTVAQLMELDEEDDEDEDDDDEDMGDEDDDDEDDDEENEQPLVIGDEEGSDEESDDEELFQKEAAKREKAIEIAEMNRKKGKNKGGNKSQGAAQQNQLKSSKVENTAKQQNKKTEQVGKKNNANLNMTVPNMVNNTPKESKKKSRASMGSTVDWTVEKMFEALTKSDKTPLPQKEEKFHNFVKNRFHVTDNSTIKQLFQKIQDSKK